MACVADGRRKVRWIDRRRSLAVVADGAQAATTVADIFAGDGRHIRYDHRNCDDRLHGIPNAKRKIKRLTARKIRRSRKMADESENTCE